MDFQDFSSEMLRLSEEHQLGTPVGAYKRYTTLSGRVAFTGILLLALSLVAAMILIFTDSDLASLLLALAGWCQSIFLVGMLLSGTRREDVITPLHPRLSVTVYTAGLLYRKGRKTQVVYWEQIKSIRRQFRVYHRKKQVVFARPAYLCEVVEQPDLLLSAAISGVDELGVTIERELIKRFFPQTQVDYKAGRPVSFSALSLTQQAIGYREKDVSWERVSSVKVGLEKLAIEIDGINTEWLTVPLADIANLCVLEALLKDIQRERGFDLSLAIGEWARTSDAIAGLGPKRRVQHSRKTSWVSALTLVSLALLVIGGATINVIAFRRSQQQSASQSYPSQYYPAFSDLPLSSPVAGLAYSAETVYNAFLAAGIQTSNVIYANGWYQDARFPTYQPEGRVVLWEESYGIVLEIATFAHPVEVKTDAADLLKDSAGYLVYTRNLCLFFYDSSISQAHIAAYMEVISQVCK